MGCFASCTGWFVFEPFRAVVWVGSWFRRGHISSVVGARAIALARVCRGWKRFDADWRLDGIGSRHVVLVPNGKKPRDGNVGRTRRSKGGIMGCLCSTEASDNRVGGRGSLPESVPSRPVRPKVTPWQGARASAIPCIYLEEPSSGNVRVRVVRDLAVGASCIVMVLSRCRVGSGREIGRVLRIDRGSSSLRVC